MRRAIGLGLQSIALCVGAVLAVVLTVALWVLPYAIATVVVLLVLRAFGVV